MIQAINITNVVKIKSSRCKFEKEFSDYWHCKLQPTRDGIGIYTAYVNFTKEINDLWVKIDLNYKMSRFLPTMLHSDNDVCGYFNGKFEVHR